MISVSRNSGWPRLWCGVMISSAAAGLLLIAAHPVLAQAKKPTGIKLPASLVIYRGDSLQTTGLSLGSWGSGTVERDTSKIFSGTESLKMTTHGMYQGASLMFTKPINLASFLSNKYSYLTVAIYPPADKPGGADGGFPGFTGKGF